MRQELERALGPIERLDPVSRGYTNNERAVARLTHGRSVFAKRAVDDATAGWLNTERRMYELLSGLPFAPRLVAWIDGDRPILVIEDLSSEIWPPPWDRARVDAVVATLSQVSQVVPPQDLPRLEDGEKPDEGWRRIMEDPGEFLSLGICDESWLAHAGPLLARAASAAPLTGDCLIHCDVRSDNLCFRGGSESALLIDWNGASIGNPLFDLAFWLPSLASEDGPLPEEVLPSCPPELVAFVAGFFASRAGQPHLPHAPLVRRVQRQQLRTALPWAARSLGLVDPGGAG